MLTSQMMNLARKQKGNSVLSERDVYRNVSNFI